MSHRISGALAAAISHEREAHAASAFSPLFPFLPPPKSALTAGQRARLAEAHAAGRAWEAQLLRQAGALERYIGWTYAEVCREAKRIPGRLRPGARDAATVIGRAERLFEITIPGHTERARLARVLDPMFWRRAIWRRVVQAKELLHLRLRLIGAGRDPYCSPEALTMRRTQLDEQRRWLKETVLRATIDGDKVELPLERVAKTPHQKLARLYAFIQAMDQLAAEEGLTVALITATLESAWHPNPAYARADHRWNGKSPGEASRALGARFQKLRRDLDKRDICVSGLWAAEPHQDGCPHRHFWLIYDPSHEREVFAAFLKYFPDKLKVRRDPSAGGDVIYETAGAAQEGRSRAVSPREGAQVDVSIIDRTKGSGASYVLKYVQKAITTEATYADLTAEVDASSASTSAGREELRQSQRTLQRIDAYRAIWRMRSFQFFGIRNCLTLWDELRRIKHAPGNPTLHNLWRLARGGKAEGSISAQQQRGDAHGFLKALGGLAAARGKLEQCQLDIDSLGDSQIRLARTPTVTRYGEPGSRIAGVMLVGPTRRTSECIPTRTVQWTLSSATSTRPTLNPPPIPLEIVADAPAGIVRHSDPRQTEPKTKKSASPPAMLPAAPVTTIIASGSRSRYFASERFANGFYRDHGHWPTLDETRAFAAGHPEPVRCTA